MKKNAESITLKVVPVVGIFNGQICGLSLESRKNLGVDVGDIVEIENSSGTEMISRTVEKSLNCRQMNEVVFLDIEDLRFLNISENANLTIRKSAFAVNCP